MICDFEFSVFFCCVCIRIMNVSCSQMIYVSTNIDIIVKLSLGIVI